MHPRQQDIIRQLGVLPDWEDTDAHAVAEALRRIGFIQTTLRASGLHMLVLGISGGVDSMLAGRLAQLAVQDLRSQTHDGRYQFIAVRLPYHRQLDEADAQAALAFIRPDHSRCVNIGASVDELRIGLSDLNALDEPSRDLVLGNVKARLRMAAQFAIANAHHGLVIGTDHAAEAVMGFFTKFGDGACDLAPLSGLLKYQVRRIAGALGAPQHLVFKTPTADLEDHHPGKPDELATGVSYAQIDAFLQGHSIPLEVAERIVAAFDASAHKRALPLCPTLVSA